MVWSLLRHNDFIETGTTPAELSLVIDELIINTPDAQHVYIVYEQTDAAGHTSIHAVVATAPYIEAATVFNDMQPLGEQHFVYLTIPVSTVEAAQHLIHDRLRPLVR